MHSSFRKKTSQRGDGNIPFTIPVQVITKLDLAGHFGANVSVAPYTYTQKHISFIHSSKITLGYQTRKNVKYIRSVFILFMSFWN